MDETTPRTDPLSKAIAAQDDYWRGVIADASDREAKLIEQLKIASATNDMLSRDREQLFDRCIELQKQVALLGDVEEGGRSKTVAKLATHKAGQGITK